jgi:hypothetical protein
MCKGMFASLECNWALWRGGGHIQADAQNDFGLEWAIKLLALCFNSRAQEASVEYFALVLSVVEDEVGEATNGRG